MKTSFVRAALVALAGLGAVRAEAQITTVIVPSKRAEAAAEATARRQEVAQDSIARVTLTGMKQWVDSAAEALSLRPDTGTVPTEATPVAPTTPQRPDSAAATPTRPAVPPEFRDGARAPNTATPLPAIAALGAAMILIGVWLRRRRPAVARSGRVS